ncbi:MAG: hypothetical protein OEM23_03475 [Gemmatimonadota bacterium]|nr:hypothetical protein [Gemmatimonadota bacterium]MDH3427473.1 hypothetical protein [Gemmatimonadota bacterium]
MIRRALLLVVLGGVWAPGLIAQEPSDLDSAREVLSASARTGGWWVTSNAAYWTEDSGEPREYALMFELEPGGFSMRGCLWGVSNGEATAPYWYFFHAWDPSERAILAYQVSPTGVVAIGHERPTGPRATEAIQRLHVPGQDPAGIRHLNEWPHPDTLESRSFDQRGDGWEPRRSYTWIWTPSTGPGACAG